MGKKHDNPESEVPTKIESRYQPGLLRQSSTKAFPPTP